VLLQLLPTYISELLRQKDRGRLVAFYQFNIVLRILVAFLSNYLLKILEKWRWMMGVEAFPSMIYILVLFDRAKMVIV
jgi:hypothetical protein